MNPKRDSLREGLLAHLPQPADLAAYRSEVSLLIEQNEKRIRRERRWVTLFWIFCAVSATIYLWFGTDGSNFPRAPFLACIFFLWGVLEMLKHHINACRIDLLKEIKQLQVQVLELQKPDVG